MKNNSSPEIKDRLQIKVGGKILDLTTSVVMSIINVTPDSFWSGSRSQGRDEISAATEKAVSEGAAILDIGGYSSRPGADDVTADEEFARVLKAFQIVVREHPGVIVSVDTFRSEVVSGLHSEFGPFIVNDISAGELDPEMIETVARLDLPYIAMHMRADPATMQQNTGYEDVANDVAAYLSAKASQLEKAGIRQLILDPGFGFAKTTEENYILMNGLEKICALGYPVLSGISRKSMIYKVLGTTPEETLAGTSAMNWESLQKGAKILRVHDTREAADIIKIHNFYTLANGK